MYEIKLSQIHGLGVFSTERIKKNTKICDYYGEEMTWADFKAKYGPYKSNSLNTYPMRRIWRILVAKSEPYKTENVVNYINEVPLYTKVEQTNLTANVILKKRSLYSLTEINPGEEFLLNYPKDYLREWKV